MTLEKRTVERPNRVHPAQDLFRSTARRDGRRRPGRTAHDHGQVNQVAFDYFGAKNSGSLVFSLFMMVAKLFIELKNIYFRPPSMGCPGHLQALPTHSPKEEEGT